MKKNRGDDQLGLQYIYTWKYQKETSCVYLYLKQAKMPFFSFAFHKIGEQELGTGGGVWYQWEEEVAGKAGRRKNIVQINTNRYLLKLVQ
jgi:hypothetical protein